MLLVIDVGNTQIKLAVFEHDTLICKEIISYDNWQNAIENILKKNKKIQNCVVASVGKLNKEDFLALNSNIKVHFISKESKFPFQNLYASPNTLGIDRMILAAGAVLQFPNKNRLVIDLGTCITYDYIDEKNNYLGGAISPGIRLRYESLHNYTAKLPLLSKEIPEKLIGNSTNQSIHSGVINGISMEIDGFINSNLHQNDNFIIILTGGDAEFLAERLKNTIFANPNFLLESLNQTFQYNQQ
ncbi:MAG: type III pantothenate kinase [Flavobacteriaceae bacterium]|nr:type III pantothenate kinase [Flavobacteriaceae bacterium]